MKNILLFNFLFFCAVFLNACNKPRSGHTTVQGQVVDMHSGVPVANATVSLMRHKLGNMGAAYSYVQSWTSDAEGRFDAGFEGDEDYSYVLLAATPLGHYTPWDKAPSLTPGRKNKNLKVPAQAPAWIKVQLVDEAPKGFKIFTIQGFKDDPYGYIYLHKDTTFIKRVDGGIMSTIAYGFKESFDEATQLQIKYISTLPLDTANLLITY